MRIVNGCTVWPMSRADKLTIATLGKGDTPHRVGMVPGYVLGHKHTDPLRPGAFSAGFTSAWRLRKRLKNEMLTSRDTAMLMVDVEHHRGVHLSQVLDHSTIGRNDIRWSWLAACAMLHDLNPSTPIALYCELWMLDVPEFRGLPAVLDAAVFNLYTTPTASLHNQAMRVRGWWNTHGVSNYKPLLIGLSLDPYPNHHPDEIAERGKVLADAGFDIYAWSDGKSDPAVIESQWEKLENAIA